RPHGRRPAREQGPHRQRRRRQVHLRHCLTGLGLVAAGFSLRRTFRRLKPAATGKIWSPRMADWKSGQEKKPNWRGDAARPQRAAKHGWKAGAEAPPGTGKRKLGAALVGLLLLGVTIAIVWWVLLPKNPPKPCLVLLATNPADHCAKLDVPMDLYGWQSAKLLAEQAKDRAGKAQAGTWGTFAP